jgi:hypothetical protein
VKKTLTRVVLLMALAASTVPLGAQSQWGPWIPINDGNQNRVLISFRKGHNCDGSACVYYWRFQNQYPNSVSLDCQLLITNDKGRQTKGYCAAGTLPPGQIKTDGGWWTSSTAEPKVLFKHLSSPPARSQSNKSTKTGEQRYVPPQAVTEKKTAIKPLPNCYYPCLEKNYRGECTKVSSERVCPPFTMP